MPFKAIIFDLDGTLLDTVEDLTDSMNLALSDYGFPGYDKDDYKMFVGKGIRNLTERVLEGTGADERAVNAVYNTFFKYYERMQKVKTHPYDGVIDTLAKLKDRGVRMAVLSNKADANTQAIVSWYFPDKPFELVFGQREGVPTKPDPSAALEIASCMGFSPEDILYIGDSGTDMRTACAANMFPLGVLWGFRSEKELLDNGAKILITRPEQILDFI